MERIKINRCHRGTRIMRTTACMVNRATIENWTQIAVRGWDMYDRHVTACVQCKAYETRRRKRHATATTNQTD